MGAPYLGDYLAGATVHFKWNTCDAAGASVTRTTDGQIRVYQEDSLVQTILGVTDTEDFDGLTGVHHVAIDLTADPTFYAAGRDFQVVVQGAEIDGQTVNAVIAHFSIEKRSAATPAESQVAAYAALLAFGAATGVDVTAARAALEGIDARDHTEIYQQVLQQMGHTQITVTPGPGQDDDLLI